MLKYSIAIATRNRLHALRLSIPRMLRQSRAPSQIVVVDSSDDHSQVAEFVSNILASTNIPYKVIQSEKGLTRQRNIALDEIIHPVVMFPDDDSIWFPEVAEEKMKVYEHDLRGSIAAVCGLDSKTPPNDFIDELNHGYSMRKDEKLKRRFARLRFKFENAFFPDPAKSIGRSFYRNLEIDDWMKDNEVEPVEWMTGFRMSFRTDVIKEIRFCTEFTNYSLFEDIDASFGAWRKGAVLAARKARVFHYKSPEKRDNGKRLGLEQLINKAYIVAKYSPPSHPARREMIRFAKYKTFQYKLLARDSFGEETYLGAKTALNSLSELVSSSPEKADITYRITLASITKCLFQTP